MQILSTPVGHVPVIMQWQFQRFLVRVLDISVACRDGGREFGATTGALVGLRNALFDDGDMFCVIQGGFWKNSTIFYVKGLTRLLRSSRSGRAYRRQPQWHVLYCFLLVLTHLALCSHDCRQSAEEKCTVDALVAREMHL